MLPSVTGIRLARKPAAVTLSAPASMAIGIRYMLATECSKPSATNADIGKMIASTLPGTSWAAKHSHTARHTRTLHRMPRKNASVTPSATLACAIAIAVSATAPPPSPSVPDQHTMSAVPSAPTRFAA